ncbi:MAG: Lipid A biosynthesis myristoyltransferase 1 [Sodalis sp.]|nr:MAG: Lipid A biosynthesis myristoyltransferase 1 [Sodalis sp.]
MENKRNGIDRVHPDIQNASHTLHYCGVWLGMGAIAVTWTRHGCETVLGAFGRVAHKARLRVEVNYEIALENHYRRHVHLRDLPQSKSQRWRASGGMAQIAKSASEREERNIIFLVPHGWAVDVSRMLMTARGQNGAMQTLY